MTNLFELIQVNEVFYTGLAAIFVIIVVGFFLGKIKLLNKAANEVFARLLLSVAMPCALFRAFPQEFASDSWHMFLMGLAGGLVSLLAVIIVSRLIFRKRWLKKNFFEHQFAFVFNNAAFLGYPIVLLVFGAEALIPYSGFMVVFNVALFSYGVWLFERKMVWKHLSKIIFNPNIVAVALGTTVFLLSYGLPTFVNRSIGYIADLTTPMSLLCIGFMLSEADLRKIWRRKWLFITCVLQLLLSPLIAWLVTRALGLPDLVIKMIVMLQALPTATSLGLFAEKYGGDTVEASELVVISTLMSIVTLPIVLTLLF